MRARQQYPWPVNDTQFAIKQHSIMCRELDAITAQRDEARAERDTLTAENARLQDQVTIKTSDLSAATRMQFAALHDALNVLRAENAELRATNGRLTAGIELARDERDRMAANGMHNQLLNADNYRAVEAELRSLRAAVVETGFNTCIVHGMFGRIGARCDPDASDERATEPCDFRVLSYISPREEGKRHESKR